MIDGGVVDASVVAVHDPRERRARALRRRHRWRRASRLWPTPPRWRRRCDAVWVCTPTVGASRRVDAALAAGRAVFCEKPLDRRPGRRARRSSTRSTPPACRASAASCCAARRCSGPCATSSLAGRSARPWRPSSATTSTSRFRAPTPRKWRADVAQAGGGCLIEHSIHDVDILRFCFGEVAAVAARTANIAGPRGDRGPGRGHACPSPRDSRRSSRACGTTS